ncbi:SusC/RagA family TonB-linked outer membrane protein [Polaribacter sp.]|uniref:SusC/RagA family TonB-linked outer membrane protein n=1 Tax=Polaribacter sp. TaxID=1920175 RepID=UPI003EF09A34
MKILNLLMRKAKAGSFLLLLFGLLCHFSSSAQSIKVSGTVTSSEDQGPIPGVSVVIKDTKNGVSTDFDGLFSINANVGDVLEFSYIGMIPKSLMVKNATMNVVLDPSVESLEEIVVIGYGTVKKKEITGAVTQVKAEDLAAIVSSDLGSALQGQAAGVNVISSASPGGDSEILIRGITSLTNNDPLYVVDGIVQSGDPRIPPSDIEAINILKDAASTAIYGVRGAAGVILITTKQGAPGSLQVRLNASYAVQHRNAAIPLMNSVEQTYFDIVTSRNVNGSFDEDVNLQILQNTQLFQNETDLNDLIFSNNVPTQNYDLNISGGTEDITYNVSLGLFDQEGLQINSNYNRFNIRANTVYEKNKLRVQTSVAVVTDERDIPQGNLLSQAIVYRPTQSGLEIGELDDLTQGGDDVNRLGWVIESLQTTNVQKRTRSNMAVNLNYDLLENLKLTANVGLTKDNLIGKIIRPYREIFNTQGLLQSQPANSYVDMRTRFTTNFLGEFGATYERKIQEDHNLTFTFFATLEDNDSEAFSARRRGLTYAGGSTLDIATGEQSVTSGFDYEEKRLGLIGRFQYNYKDKYIFSSSIRRDRSSNFPVEFNSGTFPSAAFAWNVSEEPFWASLKNTVSSFRARASFGQTGVDRTTPYSYLPGLVQSINYYGNNASGGETISLGTIQEDYANELLGWETTTGTNFGVDLAMFKNKLTISAEYYHADKEDMLFPIFLPPSAGGGNNAQVVLNVGNMVNSGAELAIGYRGRTGNVGWRMNGTFSTNTNEITKINNDTNFLLTNDFGLVGRAPDQSRVTALAVGREVSSFFLWRTDGIIDTEEKLAQYQKIDNNARMGDTKFIDQNGDNVLDDSDRVYSGSGLPAFEIGYTFNANYKNFDFSMNWYAAIGQEIMNGFDAWAYGFGRHKDLIYQWSEVNQTSTIPAYRNDVRRHVNYLGYSDLWLEDGSYLRLRQISLGYSIPKKTVEKWGLNRLRFYVRAQNPLTFTKYSGYNPEVGGGISARGLDKDTGPISSQWMLGVNFNF